MRKHLRHLVFKENGAVNIGGVLILSISMVFLAVGAIFLPISTDATSTLLAYQYSSNATITDASFTGLTAILGITPLLILIGFLTAAVVTGFMGITVMKGAGSAHASPGALILVGLSIVFIAVGLLVEPVVLDGFASVMHGGGSGISSDFTGYATLVQLSPMLVHIGYLAVAVFSGFFGIKRLSGGM